MLEQDRVTKGWQPWLTPRQTRIIRDALAGYTAREGEEQHRDGLLEWFDHEAQARRELTGDME